MTLHIFRIIIVLCFGNYIWVLLNVHFSNWIFRNEILHLSRRLFMTFIRSGNSLSLRVKLSILLFELFFFYGFTLLCFLFVHCAQEITYGIRCFYRDFFYWQFIKFCHCVFWWFWCFQFDG